MVNDMTSELTPEVLLNGIREARLVAIVRGTDGGAAAKAALAAMEEGFRYVEIALTTPDALAARWPAPSRNPPASASPCSPGR